MPSKSGKQHREHLAWFAGILDGEGCISVHRTRGRIYPRVTVGQAGAFSTPPEMLLRLVSYTGIGRIYRARNRHSKPNQKPHWQYEANGFEATQAVVAMVWQWLGEVKRDAARVALRLAHENRFVRRDLCPKGHPYTLRRDLKGRRCAPCNAERERSRRALQVS